MELEKTTVTDIEHRELGEGKSCLCTLPTDTLLIIYRNLSLLDYITIARVSKCWRSTLFNSPEILSHVKERKKLPWFVLLTPEVFLRPSLLYTAGKIGDLSTRQIYNPRLPELSGARFLMCRHGWLLLLSSSYSDLSSDSLFFLNPITRERINLPLLDVTELISPTFNVSAPPTSSSCTVFLVNNQLSYSTFEISRCARGESRWTTHVYRIDEFSCGMVVNTVLVKRYLYCVHETGGYSVYNTVSSSLKYMGRPIGGTGELSYGGVTYATRRGGGGDHRVNLHVHSCTSAFEIGLKEEPELPGLEVIKRKCPDTWYVNVEYLFRTNIEKAIMQFDDEEELVVDSFNPHAWCCCVRHKKDLDDDAGWLTFRWHNFSSYVNCKMYTELNEVSCDQTNCDILVLFQPTWGNFGSEAR